jgi:predicted nucleotidyltransferase
MTDAIVPAELLRSVVAYFEPRRIILFGSRARGEVGPDSDIDLLVVLDDDAPPEKLDWRAAYEARRDYHDSVDILMCRESGYDEDKDIVGSIAYEIAQEGVVVYERV